MAFTMRNHGSYDAQTAILLIFAFERLKPVIDEHSCQTELFGYGWQVVTVEPSTVCQLRLLQLYLTSGIVGIESYHQSARVGPRLRSIVVYVLYVERCLFLHLSLYGFFESFAGLYEPRNKAVKRFLEIFA